MTKLSFVAMGPEASRVLMLDAPASAEVEAELGGAGFSVLRVEDGEEAATVLAGEPVALCVVWARGSDATGTCERIRSGPRGAVVPLLVIGGPGTGLETRLAALEAGADSFLLECEAGGHLVAKILTMLGMGQPASLEPIEEALAVAEAVLPLSVDMDASGAGGEGVAVGQASVLDVIDRVERSLGEEPPINPVSDAASNSALISDSASVSVSASAITFDGVSGNGELWVALAAALADRRSGSLVVRKGGVERRLYLERGEIAMAISSAREDRLVELLYREGRLTEEQYEQAVMTVGASGRRVGAVLVERGFISSRELFPLVRHHYETLVYDSMAWGDCEWFFEEGARQPGERILLDVPAAALIVEGIRSRVSREEVDTLVPPGSRPVLLERGIAPLEDAGLPAEERQILDLCDGSLSTRRLADRAGVPEEEIRALLAGLAALGWVNAEMGGDGRSDQKEDRPRQVAGAEAGLRVERARVSEKLAVAEDGSYFALLEIPPEASGHEVRKAYRRLRAQFAPERFAVEELADLRASAEVVRTVLDEAYEILRDSVHREAYCRARHGSEAAAGKGA